MAKAKKNKTGKTKAKKVTKKAAKKVTKKVTKAKAPKVTKERKSPPISHLRQSHGMSQLAPHKKKRKKKGEKKADSDCVEVIEYNTWVGVSYYKHTFKGTAFLADTVEYIEVEGGRIYRNSLEMEGRRQRWLVFVPS